MLKHFGAAIIAAALLAPLAIAQGYTPPKNALGQPDLSGLWTNATQTTLERQSKFGDRLVMTEEEARAAAPAASDPGARVMSINGEFRTSFLVEPKNGRLPDFTPEAAAARAARMSISPRGDGFGPGDNPEAMPLSLRCLKDFGSSSGPPMMPLSYNNTYQIVQSPTDVLILIEMVHDARIIRLAHDRERPPAIRQWMGDAIGWYEGDTLVVETTNFRPGQAFRGGPESMKLIERFRRVSGTQLLYSFEIDEPKIFTAPIKAEVAMNATPGPLYEYACYEGNYAITNILGAQRIAEAAKIAGAGKAQ